MRLSESQMIGVAGQYLTCADLLSKGLIAYPACEGLPYDVVLDRKDVILRVQVKTCQYSRQPGKNKELSGWYSYNLVGSSGKKGCKLPKSKSAWKYGIDEVDIFALVALDIKQVGYLLRWDTNKTNYRFCDDNFKGNYFCEIVKSKRIEIKSMYVKGQSCDEISQELAIPVATVKGIIIKETSDKNAVYFSTILRDSEWFWNIKMPPYWGMNVRRLGFGEE